MVAPDCRKRGVATQRLKLRQVLHSTLAALAGELKPIVLVDSRGTFRLDTECANSIQSFDQFRKVAVGRRIGLSRCRLSSFTGSRITTRGDTTLRSF